METLSFKKTTVRTKVTMPCRLGLHMRAAVRFIEFASQFRSDIRIRKGALIGDGKSMFGLLLLGVTWRSKLRIEARGDDAETAVRKIEAYFVNPENRLDAQHCFSKT